MLGPSGSLFAEKTFVLTDTWPTLIRGEAAGGNVSGSIGEKTADLLAGADAGPTKEERGESGCEDGFCLLL